METVQVRDKLFRKFIPRTQIDQAVQSIADRINGDYEGRDPLLLGVLNGAFVFAADLIRRLTIPCTVSFVKYASYVGTHSSEEVQELIGLNETLGNRHVIVVEDIVDTGITMDHLLRKLQGYHPASVRLACLCLKPEAFVKSFRIDYLGLELPTAYVVGYGLDYDGYGRNLPEIYKLEN